MKESQFSANLVFLSSVTGSENKIIQILHRKVQKNICTELSSLGQEPKICVNN